MRRKTRDLLIRILPATVYLLLRPVPIQERADDDAVALNEIKITQVMIPTKTIRILRHHLMVKVVAAKE